MKDQKYNNTAVRVRKLPNGEFDPKHIDEIIKFYEGKGWDRKEILGHRKNEFGIGVYAGFFDWWDIDEDDKVKEIELPPPIIPTPKSHLQEVLYQLIESGSASIEQFGWMCGFRTRISDIRKLGIYLMPEHISRKSKYGNSYTFTKHILPKKELKKAIRIYKSLNK